MVSQNFDSEGAERKWKPLAPNTIASGGSKILQRSGRLRKSFGMVVSGDTVTIGTPLQLASWHHSGTGPYEITARNAKWLRFQAQDGAKFAHVVHHPGLPARPLIPTARTAKRLASQTLSAEIARAVKESS
jgi:phage gpG-like protein